jgi:hypothetical protein
MIDDLAGFLKFDPLLTAAIILALTLVVGSIVNAARAKRRRAEGESEPD